MGQPLLLTDPRDALAQKPPSSPRWARDLLVATALSFRPAGRSFGFVAFRLVWVWRYELLWPSGFSRRGRRGGHAHAASPQHAATSRSRGGYPCPEGWQNGRQILEHQALTKKASPVPSMPWRFLVSWEDANARIRVTPTLHLRRAGDPLGMGVPRARGYHPRRLASDGRRCPQHAGCISRQ